MNRQKSIMQEEQDFFEQLQKQGAFEITPYESYIDFDNIERYEMLKLSSEQKMQISELLQHVPAVVAAGTMAGAYTISFPKGLPHTLMSLKKGGFSSQIMGNGRILGSASLYPMLGQAAVFGAFTVLSIATGQFFLTQINKELHMINRKLDEILQFLYGDKRAELRSEVSFIKYAYENYAFIMAHEPQRIATICSIQNSKKVAMKDIEFYLEDLHEKIEANKNENFRTLVDLMDNKIKHIENNFNLSLQLYLMSVLMEVYYARNYETDYINYLKDDVDGYIANYSDKFRENYQDLKNHLEHSKGSSKNMQELEERKQRIEDIREEFKEKCTTICEHLFSDLHTATQSVKYYLKANGDVYYKRS